MTAARDSGLRSAWPGPIHPNHKTARTVDVARTRDPAAGHVTRPLSCWPKAGWPYNGTGGPWQLSAQLSESESVTVRVRNSESAAWVRLLSVSNLNLKA